jgi:hypothetical protein
MSEDKIPPIKAYKDHFAFIDEETVRFNLAAEMQYIIYLETLEQDQLPTQNIRYAIGKDIIIHLASIVEGALFFVLRRYQEEGGIDYNAYKHACFTVRKGRSPLVNIDSAIACYKEETDITIRGNFGFQTFNKLAKETGIWNTELYDMADTVRQSRNDIHLTYQTYDPQYTREDIDDLYLKAHALLERLEQCAHSGFEKLPPSFPRLATGT